MNQGKIKRLEMSIQTLTNKKDKLFNEIVEREVEVKKLGLKIAEMEIGINQIRDYCGGKILQ